MSDQTQTAPTHDPGATDQRRAEAAQYVQQLRAFYVHSTVFAAGTILIFVVNLATNLAAGITGEWSAWWSAWAFIGWGIGIAVHGMVVRLERPTGRATSWEQQQIDSIMAQ